MPGAAARTWQATVFVIFTFAPKTPLRALVRGTAGNDHDSKVAL
jgi:hypothetical protein